MPCRIFIFQPIKEYASQIEDRFKQNNMINVYPFGLSDKTSESLILLKGDGSTTRFNNLSINKNENKLQIKLKDIIEFIDSNAISEIDLIKINIEGGEYEIMPRLFEMKRIHNFKFIQIQFHYYDENSKKQRNVIRELLSETHNCDYCYEFIWENWTRKDVCV